MTWFAVVAIVLVGIVVVGLLIFTINTHRQVKTLNTQQETQNSETTQAAIRREIASNNDSMQKALAAFQRNVITELADIRTLATQAPSVPPPPPPMGEGEGEDEADAIEVQPPVATATLTFVSAVDAGGDPPISDRVEEVEADATSFADLDL